MEEAKGLDMSNLKRKNLSKPPSRKMEVSWKEETLKSKLSSEKKLVGMIKKWLPRKFAASFMAVELIYALKQVQLNDCIVF